MTETNPRTLGYFGMIKLVISLSFRHYKRFMFGLLAAGLAAVTFEIAAYGVVFGAVAIIEDGELPAALKSLFFGTSGQVQIITAVAVFFALMLFSASLHYLSGWLGARCRKTTFGDNITRTLQGLSRLPEHKFVRGRTPKDISRALRRDCRYSSLALTEFISLPRPVIVVFLCIVIGFIYQPVIAGIALTILALSLPIHLRTGRYGISVMERLITDGARKGKADREAVQALLTSPWSVTEAIENNHVESEPVQAFLNAYRDRVALAPVTQLTTRIISTVVFAGVGAYLFWLYIQGRLQITEIAAIFIAFRIFNAASSEIVQQLVVIVSYSPIMKSLFEFFSDSEATISKTGESLPSTQNSLTWASSDEPHPYFISLIHEAGLTRHLSQQVSDVYGLTTTFSLGVAAPLPQNIILDLAELERMMAEKWSSLSPALLSELRQAATGDQNTPQRALALLPIILSKSENTARLTLMEARAFLELTPPDQQIIHDIFANSGPFALVYGTFPKRYPQRFDGNIYVIDKNTLRLVNDEEHFHALRQNSINNRAQIALSGGGQEMDELY